MRVAKWLGVALLLALVAATAAHPVPGGTAQGATASPARLARSSSNLAAPHLYRFSLANTPALVMTWTVNSASSKGVFLVLSGSACGTDPLTTRWTLVRQASTSGNVENKLKVNFRSANPFPIYTGSYPNAGSIKVKLRLTTGSFPKVTMLVTASPSFSKVTFLPKTAAVIAWPAKSCP